MRRVEDILVGLDESLVDRLRDLGYTFSQIRILKKSIDARRKRPRFVYSVELLEDGESSEPVPILVDRLSSSSQRLRPLIIGAGPAGLFAALRLVERGFRPILFERGSKTVPRLQAISQYWRYGRLDPDNNVCFGEGGAGLYSDGKLITRIRSPYIPYVMDRLIRFGAPEEIRYLSNPHVGSDRIRKLITPLREYLLAEACEIHFDARVEELIFSESKIRGLRLKDGREFFSDAVVMAVGHSSSDFFQSLDKAGVAMEGKSFALGLRIEHSQQFINQIQYGAYAEHPALGAANYRLTDHDEKTGIGVYSFCMCPGGYVVNSSTEEGKLVSNGMSNYKRNSPFANSGIVITIDHEKNFGREVFGGLEFRDELERKTYEISKSVGSGKEMPVQKVFDFLERKKGAVLKSSSTSGVVPGSLHEVFPTVFYQRFVKSLEQLNKKMPGFLSDGAQFHALESRTSCPLRVPRHDESLQSLSHGGLYPTGEGAGYAGGITSAAVDGIRVAEAIVRQWG
jgi:uncharacterized FAD-dependent dehydrogenase